MWINAKRKLPENSRFVILRRLKHNDDICKAKYGCWEHDRDGIYTSWYDGMNFIDYLDDGQYWMEIPELP